MLPDEVGKIYAILHEELEETVGDNDFLLELAWRIWTKVGSKEKTT